MFEQRYISLKTTAVLSAMLSGALFAIPCLAGSQNIASEQLNIDFRFDNSEIDLDYHNNRNTIDRLDSLFMNVGAGNVLSVQAVSVSSPEGSYTYNIWLSERRAGSTAEFISDRFPEISNKISVLPATESWHELAEVVKKDGNLTEMSKIKIQEVLGLSCSVNDRKELMKWSLGQDSNVGDVYTYLLKNCYKDLRFSGFSITYVSGNDTLTLGSLPVMLPVEKDIPSALTESESRMTFESKPASDISEANVDDTNSKLPNTISKQSERLFDNESLPEEFNTPPILIESQADIAHSTTDDIGSQHNEIESHFESVQDNISEEQASAQVPEELKTSRSRSFDWKSLALFVLVASNVVLLLVLRRVLKENASLKEKILGISSESNSESNSESSSESSSEIEKVSNVEEDVLKADTPDDKLMQEIMEVVNENISNPELNVEFIADRIGLSRSYLHRRFKSIFKVAPATFIRSIKMNAAAKMLREGKLDISQISSAVGFSSQSSFTTAFKTFYGMTPSEFIKK